ncbi:hypothetical protein BTVI_70324 [Pitangus sulphuratus]|nr:hypothetical protein BTVI_70324 [Pitangus sulphuratus]
MTASQTELEGTHKDHRVQLQALYRIIPKVNTRCQRVLSKHFLNSVGLGAVTIALGSLLQCTTTLWVKNLFLISSLKPLLTHLQAIPTGPVTGHHREEISACPSSFPPKEVVNAMRSPLSLLQDEQTK